MNRLIFPLVLFFATILVAIPTVSAVTMDWSVVGNPGNAADPYTGSKYGSVGYSYNIGTYDVTWNQYVEFLNSNVPGGATADPLHLYDSLMSDSRTGGVIYTSAGANGSKFSVMPGRGNNPVTCVNWYDSLRFVNWLNNGQVAGMTETGAYTLLGGTPVPSNGNSVTRNAGATVFLPNLNEMYKAEYYNPASSSYYFYPTSSNIPPTASASSATPNTANYDNVVGNTTPVGSYTGTTSPYGAFDMAGNVWQWVDGRGPVVGTSSRTLAGTSYSSDVRFSRSSTPYQLGAADASTEVGFRVASIPEPSTIALAAIGMVALFVIGHRRN